MSVGALQRVPPASLRSLHTSRAALSHSLTLVPAPACALTVRSVPSNSPDSPANLRSLWASPQCAAFCATSLLLCSLHTSLQPAVARPSRAAAHCAASSHAKSVSSHSLCQVLTTCAAPFCAAQMATDGSTGYELAVVQPTGERRAATVRRQPSTHCPPRACLTDATHPLVSLCRNVWHAPPPDAVTPRPCPLQARSLVAATTSGGGCSKVTVQRIWHQPSDGERGKAWAHVRRSSAA